MKCLDCVHYQQCQHHRDIGEHFELAVEKFGCKDFKDKSKFIELPCKINSTVYRVVPKCTGNDFNCPFNGGFGFDRCGNQREGYYKKCKAYVKETTFNLCDMCRIGNDIFLTKEEAESKLKEFSNE